jgi:hypothetical protein
MRIKLNGNCDCWNENEVYGLAVLFVSVGFPLASRCSLVRRTISVLFVVNNPIINKISADIGISKMFNRQFSVFVVANRPFECLWSSKHSF